MKRSIFILYLCLFCLVSTNAKTVISPTKGKPDKNGNCLFYTLPKNTITVKITTCETISLQGPFYRYARRYLGVDESQIITENKSEWKIKKIELSRNAKADTSKIYKIKTDKKSPFNYLSKDADNILKSIMSDTCANTKPSETVVFKNSKEADLNFNYSLLGQEAIVANSTAKMAEIAAKQIYRIRENKQSLLGGDIDFPADSRSIEVLLKEMDRIETSLQELFLGKTVEKCHTKDIDIEPTNDIKQILFRFSKLLGAVEAENLAGDPIFIQIKTEKQPLNLKTQSRYSKGLFYRIPGKAQISIFDSEKTFIKQTFTIAQLGDIAILPSKTMKNKRNAYIFDPQTGALLQIKQTGQQK